MYVVEQPGEWDKEVVFDTDLAAVSGVSLQHCTALRLSDSFECCFTSLSASWWAGFVQRDLGWLLAS